MLSDQTRSRLASACEISWTCRALEPSELLETRSRLPCVFNAYLNWFGGQNIRVSYDDPSFTTFLQQKFAVSDGAICDAEIFFCTDANSSKAIGQWDANRSIASISGSGFGLLKSAVSGVASKCAVRNAFFPIHAAALKIGETGILLVGAHGFGKTTLSLALANEADRNHQPFVLLGDDWCLTSAFEGKSVIARTFDPSISINESVLGFLSDHQLRALQVDENFFKNGPKVSMPSRKVSTVSNVPTELCIDFVFLLDPTAPDGAIAVSADEFAEFAIESAYHYPFDGDRERQLHRKHWERVARNTRIWKLGRGEGLHRDVRNVLNCFAQ